MNPGNTIIFMRWRSPGFHRWPDAAGERAYLADRHRHVFHFEACMSVWHDDRDVEFHDALDALHTCTPAGKDWGASSCEVIARQLLDYINDMWPGRHPVVTVSEDGECGATVS